MSHYFHRITLTSLLLLFVMLSGWYAAMIPPGEGVDEVFHFDYVNFVARHWRLPFYNLETGESEVVMIHHPPLYYFMGAALIAPINTLDRPQALRANPHFIWDTDGVYGWRVMLPSPSPSHSGTILALYWLRAASIVLGATTVAMIYIGARWLAPDHRCFPLVVAAVAGFNPSFVYMASTVHHDILLVTLFSAGLLWCLTALHQELSTLGLITGGLILAATMLTKLTGVALVPLALITLALRLKPTGEPHPRLMQMGIVFSVAGLGAGWWFARNYLLYGDPAGQALFTANFVHMLRPAPLPWNILRTEFVTHLERTFWGAFGYMHIAFPPTVRYIGWVATGVALGGWLLVGWRIGRGRAVGRITLTAAAVLTLALLLIIAFLVRYAFFAGGAFQGRYLLPAALTIAVALVVGIYGYTDWRWPAVTSLMLTAIMIGYAIWSPATFVWPKYRISDSVPPSELATATALGIVFDGGVTLVAAKPSQQIVLPGQGLDIITYWATTPGQTAEADAYVRMSLTNDDGRSVAATEFWPDISTIPALWGDRIIAHTASFYIPPDQGSNKLTVQLTVSDGQDSAPLAASGPPQAMTAQPSVTVLELLTLGDIVAIRPDQLPVARRHELFADALELIAVVLPEHVAAGDVLPIALYWHVAQPVAADYTVFIHVLDGDGNIAAQLDYPPGGGSSPTSGWQSGQYWQDTYPVPLSDTLAAGAYTVRMGLYTWPDLQRQPIRVGDQAIGDFVTLGNINVTD